MMEAPRMSPRASTAAARWRGRLATWRRPDRVVLTPPGDAPVADAVPAHDQALLAWRAWCQARPGRRCALGLSSRWLLSAALPGAQARGPGQAMALACQRWEHYLGLGPDDWAARWRLRATALPGGWLVCAAPAALVDDLAAVAGHHGVALQWMGPWWAPAAADWLRALPRDGGHRLTLQEPDWAVHMEARDGGVSDLQAGPGPVPGQGRVLRLARADARGGVWEAAWA